VTDKYRQLELRFTHDLVDGVRVLAREIGYRAPIFSQMLTSLGGVETARRLLNQQDVQYGFEFALHPERLGRSAEAWTVRREYAGLFTDEEREIARRRLEAYGFDVDRYLRGSELSDLTASCSSAEW
jgi:hypothetical protein